ncbi:MAG: dTMP kinase [Minisyncoccia bacterium]|jgi:dTMP kinase
MKPKFIAIEGGEGSGKSTLVAALKEELGDSVFFTREPGGSPYAEVIRETTLKNPLAKTAPADTTLCLMFAARFDNAVNAIEPALKKGLSVIADRFDGSSYAYNVSAQSDYALEPLFWDLRRRLSIIPDLYVWIDVDPKEGMRRTRSRNDSSVARGKYDHFDDREIAFHEKVRAGYAKLMAKVPHAVIDANRPLEEVKRDFIAEVKRQLGMS